MDPVGRVKDRDEPRIPLRRRCLYVVGIGVLCWLLSEGVFGTYYAIRERRMRRETDPNALAFAQRLEKAMQQEPRCSALVERLRERPPSDRIEWFADGALYESAPRPIAYVHRPDLEAVTIRFGPNQVFDVAHDKTLPMLLEGLSYEIIARRRTNGDGFRGSPVRPGTQSILAVGDSVTEGFAVNDDETFCAVLEEELGSREVQLLNAGCRGYGIENEVAVARALLPQYKPGCLLLVINANDLHPDIQEDMFRHFDLDSRVGSLARLTYTTRAVSDVLLAAGLLGSSLEH